MTSRTRKPKAKVWPTMAIKPLSDEQKKALADDTDREMFGDEDAEYFHHAGIDDIGDK